MRIKALDKRAMIGSILAANAASNVAQNLVARTKIGQRSIGKGMILPIAEGYRGNARTNKALNFFRGLGKGEARDAEDGIEIARHIGEGLKAANIDVQKLSPRAMVGIRRLSKGDLAGGTKVLNYEHPEMQGILSSALEHRLGSDHMATKLVKSMSNIQNNKEEINAAFRDTAIPNVIGGAFDYGKKDKGIWRNYSSNDQSSLMQKVKQKLFPEQPLVKTRKEESLGRAVSGGTSALRGNMYNAARQMVGEVSRRTKDSTSPLMRGVHKVSTQVGEVANLPDSIIGEMGENAYARGLAGIGTGKGELARRVAYTPLQGANSYVQEQAHKIGTLQSKISGNDQSLYNSLNQETMKQTLLRAKKNGGAVADL